MTWNLAAARRRCRHGEARTRRLPAHVAADVRDVARASGFPGGRRLFNAHIRNTALHLAAKRLTKGAGSGCVLAHRRATWRGISSSRSPLIQCTCSKVQHGWTSCSRAQLTNTGQGPRLLKSRHPRTTQCTRRQQWLGPSASHLHVELCAPAQVCGMCKSPYKLPGRPAPSLRQLLRLLLDRLGSPALVRPRQRYCSSYGPRWPPLAASQHKCFQNCNLCTRNMPYIRICAPWRLTDRSEASVIRVR